MRSKLILASNSEARQKMLKNAGYDFDIIPADLDEEQIIEDAKKTNTLEYMSLVLAEEKAKAVSLKFPKNFVVGSDQTLIFRKQICSKVKTKEEAIERLNLLQGRVHYLNSGVAVYKDGEKLFTFNESAELKMRKMTADDIKIYCNFAGEILTNCVGCYALEGYGIRLFEEVDGDYFTILGMPLLPLSNFLDNEGFGL